MSTCVDRLNSREPEVPLEVRVDEGREESPTGSVDVDRNVETRLLLVPVEQVRQRLDILKVTGVGRTCERMAFKSDF